MSTSAESDNQTGPTYDPERFYQLSAFLAISVAVISMALALQTWKRNWLFLQDTSIAVIIGIIFGLIIVFANQSLEQALVLSPYLFFNVILPPIIFEGGLSIDRHLFKKNFPAIFLLALPGIAVGIFASAGILYGLLGPGRISFLDALTFGSVLGATDPVSVLATFQAIPIDPDLNEVIFGESALNDATGIIMFRLMKSFSEPGAVIDGTTIGIAIGQVILAFILAIIVGVIFGIVTCLFLKFADFESRGAVHETVVVLGLAYASFIFSEFFTLSGIITLTFGGIFVKHHVVPNMTIKGFHMMEQVLRAFAGFMETILFVYLGYAIGGLSRTRSTYDAAWIFGTEFAILVARAVVVVLFVPLSNLFRKKGHRFNWKSQVFMWYAGLRGGVAFLLALELSESEQFSESFRMLALGSTIIVIFMSVLLWGGGTARAISLLGLNYAPTHPIVAKALTLARTSRKPDARTPWRWVWDLEQLLGINPEATARVGTDDLMAANPRVVARLAAVDDEADKVSEGGAPAEGGLGEEKPAPPSILQTSGEAPPVPAQEPSHDPDSKITILEPAKPGKTEPVPPVQRFRYAWTLPPSSDHSKWTTWWAKFEDNYVAPLLWRKDAFEEAKVKTRMGYIPMEED
ncbi:Sodium/hydrogen exchanger family-domain-containing protein [Hyaloraphidium curvatum]|nr:Sodium/hydrogen exchanger family-domain-containing protein [Hyaloraphidium curvatum]